MTAKTTKPISAFIEKLNAVPLARRGADWRIAKGLIEEAIGYRSLKQHEQAMRLHDAGLPYLRFAEFTT